MTSLLCSIPCTKTTVTVLEILKETWQLFILGQKFHKVPYVSRLLQWTDEEAASKRWNFTEFLRKNE